MTTGEKTPAASNAATAEASCDVFRIPLCRKLNQFRQSMVPMPIPEIAAPVSPRNCKVMTVDRSVLRDKFVKQRSASFDAQLRTAKENSDIPVSLILTKELLLVAKKPSSTSLYVINLSSCVKCLHVPKEANVLTILSSELDEALVFVCHCHDQSLLVQDTVQAFIDQAHLVHETVQVLHSICGGEGAGRDYASQGGHVDGDAKVSESCLDLTMSPFREDTPTPTPRADDVFPAKSLKKSPRRCLSVVHEAKTPPLVPLIATALPRIQDKRIQESVVHEAKALPLLAKALPPSMATQQVSPLTSPSNANAEAVPTAFAKAAGEAKAKAEKTTAAAEKAAADAKVVILLNMRQYLFLCKHRYTGTWKTMYGNPTLKYFLVEPILEFEDSPSLYYFLFYY
jgi:hypothetical protein